MLTFDLSSCKYKVTPLITTRLPISTLQLLATLEKLEKEKKLREKYRNADPTDILNNLLFKEL